MHDLRHRCMRAAAIAATLGLALAGCSGSSSGSDPGASTGPTTARTAAPRTGSAPAPSDGTTADPIPAGSARVPAGLKAGLSDPVEDPYYPDTSNPEIDVLHYGLNLTYDRPTLRGTATVTFRATQETGSVRLDLSDALDVEGVVLDGAEATYTHRQQGLVTQTPGLTGKGTHTLVIRYAGRPTGTPAPSRRPDMTGGLGWQSDPAGTVFTFQEPYGAFTWYPSNDHPSDEALFDATITTPRGDVGVFNGTLESLKKSADHTTTRWHLDKPASTYLTTLAIGPYREYTAKTASGTTLSFWLLPRDRHALGPLRREAVRAFDWLVEHAGPYPFSTLGMVVVGGASAMETQTMMTLSRGVLARPDAVIEHEMAHQWFGDSVSPVDWQGMWLNEGWAMYMQQWYESDLGRYQYAGGISRWRSYDNDSRRVSGPPGNYDPQGFGDVNVYLGPAMMLDAIRRAVGNATFDGLVKAWAAEHAGQNVDRADFTTWVNDYTGRDFTELIDLWLDSPRTPRTPR